MLKVEKDNRTLEVLLILLWATVTDVLRDVYGYSTDLTWGQRHFFIWLNFYPVLAYLLFRYIRPWYWWIILPGIYWVIWQLVLRLTGTVWESFWLQLLLCKILNIGC